MTGPEDFDALILDVDGVLFQGETQVSGVDEAITKLVDRGVPLAFITNNVTVPKQDTVKRIQCLMPGIPVCLFDPIDVLESSFLPDHRSFAGPCFLLGTRALRERLCLLGVRLANLDANSEVSAVLVGSTMSFDYEDLTRLTRAINGGAVLWATGRESVFLWRGELWPGTGALVAALEAATGCRAIVLGKPSPAIFQLSAANFPPGSRVTVVGDDLITDIQGARSAGFQSVLVMSGVSSREQLRKADIQPDYVTDDLKAFVSCL